MEGLIEFVKLLWQKLKRRNQRNQRSDVRTITVKFVREESSTQTIPPVEVPKSNALVLPTNSILTLNYFMSKNKDLVYSFLLREMDKAIQNNMPFVELFRVGTTPLTARVEKKDYEKSILDIQKYYIEQEEYEKANVCQQLIDRHKVNQIIDT